MLKFHSFYSNCYNKLLIIAVINIIIILFSHSLLRLSIFSCEIINEPIRKIIISRQLLIIHLNFDYKNKTQTDVAINDYKGFLFIPTLLPSITYKYVWQDGML